MIKSLVVAACLCAAAVGAFGAADRIVTGSERGTYIEIGRDLSRLVAQAYVESRECLGFPMLGRTAEKV